MARQGNRRTLLLGVLLLAIVGLAASRLWPEPTPTSAPPSSVAQAQRFMYRTPAVDAFMDQVVAASKIADPLERCLRMPDPPGTHWHAEAVAAYCRDRTAAVIDVAHFRALIAAGKGDQVDRLFDGYLKTQMHDRRYTAMLDHAMYGAGFHDASDETRKAIDAWKRQRPRSVFAFAASGMQYHAAAFAARGAAFATKTTEQQWQAAMEQAGLARRDFDRAAGMQPAVPSIYSTMLANGVLTSDMDYARSARERGLAVQPGNLAIRLSQAAMTGEKWGGSTAWVARQAEEAAIAARDNPLLWVAVGRARIEAATEGHLTEPADRRFLAIADEVATASDFTSLAQDASRARKYDESLVLAVEALRFDNAQARALGVIGHAANNGAYREWGKAELIRATREHPDDAEVAGRAGVWLRYLGEPALAEPLMIYATEHGKDDWVLARLGDFYTHEGHDYAKARAIADDLVERKPDDGDGYVIRACVERDTNDPHRFVSARDFVDRFANDPDQQGPVAEMRAWLASHPEPVAGTKT